jgi:hypothetical protein
LVTCGLGGVLILHIPRTGIDNENTSVHASQDGQIHLTCQLNLSNIDTLGGSLAQVVEHRTFNPGVVGSSPA